MLRKIVAALVSAAAISVSAATFPTMESGRYADFCEDKWTKKGVVDQEMSKYCQSMEEEGYYEAQEIIKQFERESWIQAVIDHAVKKWTKKGMRQDAMVAFTLKQITDGFEELVIAASKPGFDKLKVQKCSATWGVQFDMVWYCYKKD